MQLVVDFTWGLGTLICGKPDIIDLAKKAPILNKVWAWWNKAPSGTPSKISLTLSAIKAQFLAASGKPGIAAFFYNGYQLIKDIFSLGSLWSLLKGIAAGWSWKDL